MSICQPSSSPRSVKFHIEAAFEELTDRASVGGSAGFDVHNMFAIQDQYTPDARFRVLLYSSMFEKIKQTNAAPDGALNVSVSLLCRKE